MEQLETTHWSTRAHSLLLFTLCEGTCSDSEPDNGNLLKQCVTDGPFLRSWEQQGTVIGPLSDRCTKP